MALTKLQKSESQKGILEAVKDANSIVFVGFKKLNVAETISLRRALRANDVSYLVVKKTLLRRVLAERGYTGEVPELPGELAIAPSADLLAGAREVFTFQKTHKENIDILGGVFDGAFKNSAEMMSIATIPPREVLLAQFLNLIKSPIQRFTMAVSEIAKSKA